MSRFSRLFLLIVTTLIGVTLLLQKPAALLAAPAAQADAPTGDPVIAAAGDISDCGNVEDYMTAVLLDSIPGTVLAIGDTAYGAASLQEFNDCYGPSWGRHKDRTRPIPGNHEYASQGANGYFTYFGNADVYKRQHLPVHFARTCPRLGELHWFLVFRSLGKAP